MSDDGRDLHDQGRCDPRCQRCKAMKQTPPDLQAFVRDPEKVKAFLESENEHSWPHPFPHGIVLPHLQHCSHCTIQALLALYDAQARTLAEIEKLAESWALGDWHKNGPALELRRILTGGGSTT